MKTWKRFHMAFLVCKDIYIYFPGAGSSRHKRVSLFFREKEEVKIMFYEGNLSKLRSVESVNGQTPTRPTVYPRKLSTILEKPPNRCNSRPV